MNIEKNRLDTFADWPTDSIISPTRLAKAGFFATGAHTVMCFACGLRITEWNYGDQAMARHRHLSPQCAFVLDPVASTNIPDLPGTTSTTTAPTLAATTIALNSCMSTERARIATFEHWPKQHIVTPLRLAKAGFFYVNEKDITKCAFCHGALSIWEDGDDPDQIHRQFFPDCTFVKSVIAPRLDGQLRDGATTHLNANISLVARDNLQELGVNAHTAPKNVKYTTCEARVRTYDAWPRELIQTPQTLAEAGFYYEGKDDLVRCFHCDGGLTHWDPEDDPWTEHARWFPKCAYVQLVKGYEFVAACTLETQAPTTQPDKKKTMGIKKLLRKRTVTERDVQEQMRHPAVLTALEVGIHVGRIKRAIKEKLESTGKGFATANAVIEAALGVQCDEVDEQQDTLDSQLSAEVARTLNNCVQEALEKVETDESVVEKAETIAEEETGFKETSTTPSVSLEEENRLLKEAKLCKICMDNEIGIVFLPCGHLTTCINCAPNLQDCPLCRSPIKATVRTFLS